MWDFLFNGKNEYYVIVCSDETFRAAALDYVKSNLVFKNYYEGPLSEIAALNKKFRLRSSSRLIFIHDGQNAVTYSGFVRLEKSDAGGPITDVDFDRLISKATWQFFNRFNEEAKNEIFKDKIESVLTGNRYFDILLDGRPVINPIGLSAKFAEIEMEQTFLSRSLFQYIHDSFPNAEHVFHLEASQAVLDSASAIYFGKQSGVRKMYLGLVRGESVSYYSFENPMKYFGAVSFPRLKPVGGLSWGVNRLVRVIASYASLEERTALAIWNTYVRGGMPAFARNDFKKSIQPTLKNFLEESGKFLEAGECVLFADPPLFAEPTKSRSVNYVPLTASAIQSRFNIDIQHTDSFPEQHLSPLFLTGLIAYLRRTGDNELRRATKHNAQWLLPENVA